MNRRIATSALCTAFVVTALTGCQSGTTAGATKPGTTTTGAAANGGGPCSYLTSADVAPLFTGSVDGGTAGTDGADPGSKDCLYQIQGSDKNGLMLSTGVDFTFVKGEFSVSTPVSGVGDEAYSLNNGLALLAKKGAATCLATVTISDPGQVTVPVDGGGAVAAADRPAFAAKLGALCAKTFG
jgi:hypothetical protein